MIRFLKKKTFLIISVICCILTIIISFDASPYSRLLFEVSKYMEIYNDIIKTILISYVDSVAPERLFKKSIESTLNALDPYTNYYGEENIEEYKFLTRGEYGGIGAVISKDTETKYIYISEVYENYPAHKSGLRSGDYITHINDQSTIPLTPEEASRLLKGTPKTKVTLTIKRPYVKDSVFTLSIVREEIKISDVFGSVLLNGEVAYVKLNSFTEGASSILYNIYDSLKKAGARKYILDLRGNGGGLLNEAVRIVNIFIPKGKLIVSTKGRLEEWDKSYYSQSEPIDTTGMLAILIDETSASASEITAGVIQDYDRGIIVGDTSFGKGLVQQTKELPYNTKLKITVAKYYTPSGRSIQKVDYSKRDKKDNPIIYPDSLHLEFFTANKRKVRGNEGIVPDIIIKNPSPSEIAKGLIQSNLLFKFSVYYYNSNPYDSSIIEDDEQLWNKLLEFLEKNSWLSKINISLENEIATIKKTISEKSNLYANIAHKINEIEGDLLQIKKHLLEDARNEILKICKYELMKKYYSNQKALLFYLNTDPVLDTTLKILTKDTQTYYKLLNINPKK